MDEDSEIVTALIACVINYGESTCSVNIKKKNIIKYREMNVRIIT